ncbi:MAG: NlpC/P60 family protein [Armatimonadota bacterium]
MARRKLGEMVGCVACAALIISLPSVATAATHKVRPGDTLWCLAKKYHTTPGAIARANGIRENSVLTLGRKLVIPGRDHTRSARSRPVRDHTNKSSGRAVVHTTCDGACLRTGPGTQFSKLAVLPEGTVAKKLSRRGNWLKIVLADGKCGFIYRPLVDLGPGTGSKRTTCKSAEGLSARCGDDDIVQTALAYRGARYRRGGTSRGGFDCSGFTRYIFAKYGIMLPHSSSAQSRIGTPVSRSELRPGDLVFFQTYRRGVSHVGIYIGNNRFIHASTHRRGVTVDTLDSAYYAPRYRGARRVR